MNERVIVAGMSVNTQDPAIAMRAMEAFGRVSLGLALEGVAVNVQVNSFALEGDSEEENQGPGTPGDSSSA